MLKDTLSTKSEYLLTKDTTELRAEDGDTCQSISVTTWIVEIRLLETGGINRISLFLKVVWNSQKIFVKKETYWGAEKLIDIQSKKI